MFTGIVAEVGAVAEIGARGGGRRLRVRCESVAGALKSGGSVAVEGVCLTAVEVSSTYFTADVSSETSRRTTLGALARGDRVNLELPLAVGEPVGGHFVQGHVDGTGAIAALAKRDAEWLLRVDVDEALARYVVEKGSVAVAGISLTVAEASDHGFAAAVVPFTYDRTTLKFRRAGDRVNVEVDMIGKYVERFCGKRAGGLTAERLAELGYGR